MGLAIAIHIIAAIIWVGGMFFAYVCMRPAASQMFEPPVRIPFLHNAMGRFFSWVWLSVIILPISGFWMTSRLYSSMSDWPISIHIMFGLGMLMILLFIFVFLSPYRNITQALKIDDFATAGKNLERLRRIVGLNLTLGIIVVISASAGRFIG